MRNRVIHPFAVVIQPDTAQTGRINPAVQIYSLSGERFQLFSQPFFLVLCHSHRRDSSDRHNAVIPVILIPVSVTAMEKVANIPLFCEQLQEIEKIRVQLIPKALIQDLAPFLPREELQAQMFIPMMPEV